MRSWQKTGCVIHLSFRSSFGAGFFFSRDFGLSQGRGNYKQFHKPTNFGTKLLGFCEKDEGRIHPFAET